MMKKKKKKKVSEKEEDEEKEEEEEKKKKNSKDLPANALFSEASIKKKVNFFMIHPRRVS